MTVTTRTEPARSTSGARARDALARTKAGSEARAIVEATAAACSDALARGVAGVTVAEAEAEYRRRGGRVATFNASFFSLARRQVLVAVGGRAQHTRYAPAGARVVASDATAGTAPGNQDDAETVLAALVSAFTRLRRPVTTREVGEEVDRLGLVLRADSANAVKKRLETMATTRVRGPVAWRAPRVRRIEGNTATGTASALWVPADVPADSDSRETVPRSDAEAARFAVGAASRAVGRPVAASEVGLWAAAATRTAVLADVDPEVARRLRDGSAREMCTFAAQADARHAGADGRVVRVVGDTTCHGGALMRYVLSPADDDAVAQCRFEDALASLLPADELREIAALEHQARRRRLPYLAEWAELRRAALAEALCRAAAPCTPWQLVPRARQAVATVLGWVTAAPLSPDQRSWRRRDLEERLRHLHAVSVLFASATTRTAHAQGGSRSPADPAALRLVGECGTVALRDLEPFAAPVAARLDLAPSRALGLASSARRFPNPFADRRGRLGGTAAANPLSLVDRADAMLAILDALPNLPPQMRALLVSARVLTGRVLRDEARLRAMLTTTPPSDVATRASAAVSLGLMGVGPALADVLRHPADEEGARAWVVALALSRLRRDEVLDALRRGVGSLEGAALHIVNTAARRVVAGNRVSVL